MKSTPDYAINHVYHFAFSAHWLKYNTLCLHYTHVTHDGFDWWVSSWIGALGMVQQKSVGSFSVEHWNLMEHKLDEKFILEIQSFQNKFIWREKLHMKHRTFWNGVLVSLIWNI